jgi:predicted nucleic acid-binding protein
MALYVVDASVVVQYAIAQVHTPEARILVVRLYQSEQLCIPEFCLLECVNVLWKEVRFQGLPQVQAEQMVHELLALPLQIMPIRHFCLVLYKLV